MRNTIEQQLIDSRPELLFRINPAGELAGVNEPAEPDNDQAPKLYLFLGKKECIVRKSVDLTDAWLQNLRNAIGQIVDNGDYASSEIEDLVYMSSRVFWKRISVKSCFAFYIPKTDGFDDGVIEIDQNNKSCLQRNFPYAYVHLNYLAPLVANVVNGEAVAICRTVRRHSLALECGVDTIAEFRGKGFGTEVARSWARKVWNINLIPCYSVHRENKASLAIVNKIGINRYGMDVTVDWLE